MGEIYVVHI